MSKKLPYITVRNGKYYSRTRVDDRDVWKSFGTDKEAAVLFATEYQKRKLKAKLSSENDDLEKLFAVRRIVTLREAAQEYLAARHDLKASSLRNYNNYLENHLLPVFGDADLHQLSETDIEYFLKKLCDLGLSPKHCNDVVRFARAVCNAQLRRRKIDRNPFAGARLLRESKGRQHDQVDPLSIDEIETVIAALPDKWKPLFTLLSETGMRPGEAFALRWRDVDWRKQELKVRLTRVKGIEDAPKTVSSIREVKLTPGVLATLKKMKNEQKVSSLDDYVFVRSDGRPFNKYVDEIWTKTMRKVGIRHRPSYQLRHSYISNCLHAGIEVGWIAKQVGHSNLKMIYEVYGKYIPNSGNPNEDKLLTLFNKGDRVPQNKRRM